VTVVAQTDPAKRVTWTDVQPLHARLSARGLTAPSFDAFVDRTVRRNAARVAEGDLDHLVFYLLQSTTFTKFPPIEPALSAKALVDSLSASERAAFLQDGQVELSRVPAPVRERAAAFVRALDSSSKNPRLTFFRELASGAFPDKAGRNAALSREYLRAMKFLYEKEFVASRTTSPAAAVADLYRQRGLSTDTAVEAGYLVHQGLAIVKALEPARQIRRVLIVGPGMDLAPRTALDEAGPPASYQPWAVIDALLSLNLARLGELDVVAADINPRVVAHLDRARSNPPTLTLFTELREGGGVALTPDYKDYFAQLGQTLTDGKPVAVAIEEGHLKKSVAVGAAPARALDAARLDVVTERLNQAPFDLVIATNILPYFDDVELMLAMSNIAARLAPNGVFLHNEPRPLIGEVGPLLGLDFEQSRVVSIATVAGAPPLVDSVWLHRRRASARP
jgi:SAM-dependent methyltransferase